MWWSRLWGCLSLQVGNLNRWSAINISLSGLHKFAQSYFYRQKSILCSLGVAPWVSLCWIISMGLWSFCTVMCLPSTWVWNFYMLYHTDRHSIYLHIWIWHQSMTYCWRVLGSHHGGELHQDQIHWHWFELPLAYPCWCRKVCLKKVATYPGF